MPVAARNLSVIAVGAAMAAAALVVPTGAAHAQRKPPASACGIKALPFVQGNEWVYTAVQPPEDIRQAAQKIAANKPKQPAKVVIKVVSVTALPGGAAEIVLEETADAVTKTTKATCVKDALDVGLESFFFSGEPGGALNYEISEPERPATEHSYVFQLGTLNVPEWIVNIKASFKRLPSEGIGVKLVDGTLDLQRIVKRGAPETVTTGFGSFNAVPVQVELVGSVTLAYQPEEKFSIPANTFSKLWIADNVGVVQVSNSNGHTYHLTELRIGGQPQPAQPGAALPAQPGAALPAQPGAALPPGAVPPATPAPAAPATPAPAAPAPSKPAAPAPAPKAQPSKPAAPAPKPAAPAPKPAPAKPAAPPAAPAPGQPPAAPAPSIPSIPPPATTPSIPSVPPPATTPSIPSVPPPAPAPKAAPTPPAAPAPTAPQQ